MKPRSFTPRRLLPILSAASQQQLLRDGNKQSSVIFRVYDKHGYYDCSGNTFDEYTVDMETYIDIATRYKVQAHEQNCLNCNECENCEHSLEYVEDALDFAKCKELKGNSDYSGITLHSSALCAPDGSIMIGVYTDDQCSEYLDSMDSIMTEIGSVYHGQKVYDDDQIVSAMKEAFLYLLEIQLSGELNLTYNLLKQISAEDGCTIICSEVEDDEDGIVVNEACRDLYDAACSDSADFIQSPVSEVTSIARSSNSNAQTMICGKAEDLAPDTPSGEAADVAYDTPSEEDDEYEGDIDEYVLDGGEDDDFDEEAKVGTHEDSSSTYIHVCMIVLVGTSIAYFMF